MERRCACGLPQVIATHPRLEDGEPFPTLWWLTCRAMSAAVSRLESEGWMEEVNRRLASDAIFRRELERSTSRYTEVRDRLEALGVEDHPGGGPGRVKCLHAHTAHQLATGDNPVGAQVLKALSFEEPREPCV